MTPIEIRDALRNKRALLLERLRNIPQNSYNMNDLQKHLEYCRNLIDCDEYDWSRYINARLLGKLA
jgi:hypothetical protein